LCAAPFGCAERNEASDELAQVLQGWWYDTEEPFKEQAERIVGAFLWNAITGGVAKQGVNSSELEVSFGSAV
jgi:hypothetical protein